MLLPRAAFDATPKPLFAPPTFREEPDESGDYSPSVRVICPAMLRREFSSSSGVIMT